jgi:hypothetical protein
MPRVGFEPTIQVFEREKTFHVLDRVGTVIGWCRDWKLGTPEYEVRALATQKEPLMRLQNNHSFGLIVTTPRRGVCQDVSTYGAMQSARSSARVCILRCCDFS